MSSTSTLEHRAPRHPFYLEHMGRLYDRAAGQANEPHRHDYYTVLLIEHATGQHLVDYQAYPFQEREVHFVSPGQVHQVLAEARPEGWVFTFSRDFLAENNIPESFISNINLFKAFGDTPPLQLDPATFNRLLDIISQMENCLSPDLTYRERALGALLQLFLIYCNNTAQLDTAQLDEENGSICILRDFKQLIDQQYASWHKVSEYAGQLHITPKHLSQTVKELTGKPAKEAIQDRLVLEAKRLLLHTDLAVKEVGYRLGFEEPLHFSGFFKKRVGASPSAFRSGRKLS